MMGHTPGLPTDPGRVAFVGAGPGDLGLLTVRAVNYLQCADALVVDPDVPLEGSIIARWCPQDIDVIEVDGRRPLVEIAANYPGGLVVRLMLGDPAVFSGLSDEALACAEAGVPFEVVPGVSLVTAVPSYAGVPLTSSDSTGVYVLSARQRGTDLRHLVDPWLTVVVLGNVEDVRATFGELLAAGRDPLTPVAVTAQGTSVRQRTTTIELGGYAHGLKGLESPVLAVVGSPVALRERLSWFETKPLFGWRVLVPRTQAQAGTMTERLEMYGAEPTVVPTLSVEPPRNPQQLERAVRGLVLGRYEWVGFTSANAVRALREQFEALGLDVRSVAGVKVAAVGGATAEALRAWGIIPDLLPESEQSARGLLEAWPAHDEDDPINRVFLPRADIATETLVAGLLELGWEVDDVTAYRTVRAAPPAPWIRDAIKGGAFDAVLFTSSSTVRNLVGIAGKPHPTTIIGCIGPATARTAEELGLRVDVLAAEASATVLVDGLAEHAAARARAVAETGTGVVRPSQRRAGNRRKERS